MANASLTSVTAALKDDYHDYFTDLNNETPILAQFESNTNKVMSGGKRAVHAVHIGRSRGLGAVAENETTPTAGRQRYEDAYIPLRTMWGKIEFTVQALEAMKGSQTAFVDVIENELDGILNDVAKDRNRQAWGTSNGVIAAFATNGSGTTLTMAEGTTRTQMEQLYFDGGMLLDIGTVADPNSVNATPVEVTGYDPDALTITISAARATTGGTHFAFRAAAGGASSDTGLSNDGQRELTGLQDIVAATGVIHTIDPSTEPKWKAFVDSASANRTWSENITNKAIHRAERGTGSQVDQLWCCSDLFDEIAAQLRSMRRNVDNVDLKAGYTGMNYSTPLQGRGGRSQSRAISYDNDCPENKLFGLSTEAFVRYVGAEATWMELDGSMFARTTTGGYSAEFYIIDDIAIARRDANFLIDDLSQG